MNIRMVAFHSACSRMYALPAGMRTKLFIFRVSSLLVVCKDLEGRNKITRSQIQTSATYIRNRHGYSSGTHGCACKRLHRTRYQCQVAVDLILLFESARQSQAAFRCWNLRHISVYIQESKEDALKLTEMQISSRLTPFLCNPCTMVNASSNALRGPSRDMRFRASTKVK